MDIKRRRSKVNACGGSMDRNNKRFRNIDKSWDEELEETSYFNTNDLMDNFKDK